MEMRNKYYCQHATNIKRKRGNEKREKDKEINNVSTRNDWVLGRRLRGAAAFRSVS